MIIIPAIDLKDGKCVRLKQGRADDSKVYSDKPADMARHWVDEGAQYLHVVDLDGAFQGKPVHTDVIRQIVEAIDIPVEIGGGLRTDEDIRTVLSCGVHRAIIGTRAADDPDSFVALVEEFDERIIVGIDAKNGMVQGRGWVDESGIKAVELGMKMNRFGVRTIIYTDIATDGMMMGTNVDEIDAMCRAVSCDVIASGGVTNLDDVHALRALGHSNLVGAIVGKALYEEKVSLAELMGKTQ